MSEDNFFKDDNALIRYIFQACLVVSFVFLLFTGIWEARANYVKHGYKKYDLNGTVRVYETKNVGQYADFETQKPMFQYECLEDFYSSTRIDWSVPLTVVLDVHFREQIPVNTDFLLFTDRLIFKILVNGVFFCDSEGTGPKVRNIYDRNNIWVSFSSPGITTADKVEIVLTTKHYMFPKDAYKRTFDSFQISRAPFILNRTTFVSYFSLLLAVCAIVLGLMTIVMYIVFKKCGISITQLFYFAVYVLTSGFWYVVNENINNFFVDMSSLYRTLEMADLMLLSGFFSMYLQSFLQGSRKRAVRISSTVIVILAPVCEILQFLTPFDMYAFYGWLRFILILNMLLAGGCIVYEGKFEHFKPADRIIVACLIIIICFVLDLLTSSISFIPHTIFSKLGSIYFVISQCRELLDYMVMLIQRTAEAKYYKEIAYKDTLTHVSNRTSWNERIKKIEEDHLNLENYGVVLFDLNNLKDVNDHMGHACGDKFISSACKIICDVFDNCEVFRIGGDEFVALMKNFTHSDCDRKILEFNTACGKWNWENSDALFDMSVASGGALFDPQVDTTFEETISRADAFMYQEKLEMKGNVR